MTSSTHTLIAETSAVTVALDALCRDVATLHTLDDETVLTMTRTVAGQQRSLDNYAALLAGELDRRSTRELGMNGLAQRSGHRTPEELVRATTGVTRREATTVVRAGRLAVEAADAAADSGTADLVTGEVPVMTQPWLQQVGAALVAGTLSVEGAESIRNGLGEPSTEITIQMLQGAVTELLTVAGNGVDADQLFRAAKDFRNLIDETGIKDREKARYEARSLKFFRNADGSARLSWDMDPETATAVGDIYDRSTSPRRKTPAFVDTESDRAVAKSILEDPRTTAQFVSDVFTQLLIQGADADSSQIIGSGAPTVMIYVTKDTLDKGEGHGYIAGQPEPVSLATIERMMCSGGTQQVSYDYEGKPLDLEREQRLFTVKQKKVLASKWGGCGVGLCDRPASWTEAHHAEHWGRDHGKTNIDDGILLCAFHHRLFHANGWETIRRGNRYYLRQPNGTETELLPKNPIWNELQAHNQARARTG